MRTATDLERFLELPAWVIDSEGHHHRRADFLDDAVSDAVTELGLWDNTTEQLASELRVLTEKSDGTLKKTVKVADVVAALERYGQ